MHITHIASEMTPICKVGGLADVVYGLSKALSQVGHTLEVILPKYDILSLSPLKKGADLNGFTAWHGSLNGIAITLIESHDPKEYFNRQTVYSCPDDAMRFLEFNKGALLYLENNLKKPDLIHLHDWPTGLLAFFLKKSSLKHVPTVFTIHNLEHQGLFPYPLLSESPPPPPIRHPLDPNLINCMRAGIEMSTAVTTVSPSYRKEILEPLGGCGLEAILQSHEKKLSGLLNGIDEEYYNPEEDEALFTPFNKKNTPIAIEIAKEKNKQKLFELYGKPYTPGQFTLSAITRLSSQKSPELIAYALEKTLSLGGNFILVGSLHGTDYADLFTPYQDHPNVILCLNKDDLLAHRVYAASDGIIIPSLFEPCGLTQMIALRYGTLPLVRKTGGLADTIFDLNTCEHGNGFTFDFPDTQGVDWVLTRAFNLYQNNHSRWLEAVRKGMNQNFSWDKSAKAYIELYQTL